MKRPVREKHHQSYLKPWQPPLLISWRRKNATHHSSIFSNMSLFEFLLFTFVVGSFALMASVYFHFAPTFTPSNDTANQSNSSSLSSTCLFLITVRYKWQTNITADLMLGSSVTFLSLVWLARAQALQREESYPIPLTFRLLGISARAKWLRRAQSLVLSPQEDLNRHPYSLPLLVSTNLTG